MISRTLRLATLLLASQKAEFLAKKYPTVSRDIIDQLEEADPAKGKSLEWMVRQLANLAFQWPEDRFRIQTALQTFYQIKKSPRLIQQYRVNPDISKHTLQSLEDLDDAVKGVTQRPESISKATSDVEKIYDDGIYAVLKPLTTEAACSLASGTKWCTSNPDTAQFYMDGDGLYIWYKNGQKAAQSSGSQFMNLKDRRIRPTKRVAEIFWQLFKVLPEGVRSRLPSIEEEIAQDSEKALYYAYDVVKGPFPAGEPAIAQDPDRASQYAWNVLKDRFPAGESAIAQKPNLAVAYAERMLKGRFPAAEQKILENPHQAVTYAQKIIGRWPKLEQILLENNSLGYQNLLAVYAASVIKGRWPEAEPIIAQDADAAASYAFSAIKDRFPAGESAIAKSHPSTAYNYARNVLKDRFPAAEPEIAKYSAAIDYARDVIKGRFPEAEDNLKQMGLWREYVRDVVNKYEPKRRKKQTSPT